MRPTHALLPVSAIFLLMSAALAQANERPNIVLILADDFGVGDIQAHYPENKIATPNLDRLVREGRSFTDAHSPSAVCTPTRYGILTGRYAWRTRLQEWVLACYEPPLIAEGRPTLPGMLSQSGYHTTCIGKWHLGWDWPGPQQPAMTEIRNGQKDLDWDFTKPIAGGPINRGFDRYYGVDLPNMPPFTFIKNDRVLVLPTSTYDDRKAIGTVRPRQFNGCPMAPGWRLDEILPELTRQAVATIKEESAKDRPFFLYFSMTSPHEPVSPSEKFVGKSGIAPIADFVMETDASVGQILQAIDDAKIGDNTIVIFTADNGHSHYTGWNELVRAGHRPSGPFRGHKGDIWEGGHRVPLVVRWPGQVSATSKSDQLISLTDLSATIAEMINVPLPPTGAEDSISFAPAMANNASNAGRTTLVNHSNMGEFAYRDGDWKLVFRMAGRSLDESRGKQTVAELYHLSEDIAEENDLASKLPERVTRMTDSLQQVIERGASRDDRPDASNDAQVDFTTTQRRRWVEPAKND